MAFNHNPTGAIFFFVFLAFGFWLLLAFGLLAFGFCFPLAFGFWLLLAFTPPIQLF